jgi:hypothetical protein
MLGQEQSWNICAQASSADSPNLGREYSAI